MNRFKERWEEVLSRFSGFDLEPADLKAILDAAIQSFTSEELEMLLITLRNGRWVTNE